MSILCGLKVLDFGSAIAAPYAAMMLADLGATVIKVEKPRRGDLIRFTDDYVNGASGYFLGINRGKKSVTLDLRKPEGRDVALRLCETADVVLENFRPGMMAQWGLGYEEVRAVRPDVIYCSVSAFGEVEGFTTRSGNDIVAQAFSGLMALTGPADGGPAKAGAPVADSGTAMLATIAILAALVRRHHTGQGAHATLSLLEGAYALMPNFTPSALNGAPTFRRSGTAHPQLAPYQAYVAADGRYFVLGVFHRESWRRLCVAIDRPELQHDERFYENSDRVKNRAVLNGVLGGEFVKWTADEWLARLDEADIPVAPVMEVEESLEFFTSRHSDLLVEDVPTGSGAIRMLASPLCIDGEHLTHPHGAPSLGEHTTEVLLAAGLTSDELDRLQEAGIVGPMGRQPATP